MRLPVQLVALGVILLSSPSCATLMRASFANPVVEVKDVRVVSLGLSGGTLDVVLDVYNPNEYRVDATRITYAFSVDTTEVATGAIDRVVTLTDKGRAEIVVPVTFGYSALSIAMREYLAKGALNYRVRGQFTIVTPFGNFTRPYSGRGRVEGMP
jgi:LEA14-like dessication related protein